MHSGFQVLDSGLLVSRTWIPDSKDSGFQKEKWIQITLHGVIDDGVTK